MHVDRRKFDVDVFPAILLDKRRVLDRLQDRKHYHHVREIVNRQRA
jgi:hypothetical protein